MHTPASPLRQAPWQVHRLVEDAEHRHRLRIVSEQQHVSRSAHTFAGRQAKSAMTEGVGPAAVLDEPDTGPFGIVPEVGVSLGDQGSIPGRRLRAEPVLAPGDQVLKLPPRLGRDDERSQAARSVVRSVPAFAVKPSR